jgi:hypothetical protein
MEYEITIHKEEEYIEIITRGMADKEGSLLMAKAITENMRKNSITKALIDHRKIDAVSGQTIEIYDRPGILKVIGVIMKIRIAEVINPAFIEHFRFFETVCKNRGYSISIHEDREKALDWLLNRKNKSDAAASTLDTK